MIVCARVIAAVLALAALAGPAAAQSPAARSAAAASPAVSADERVDIVLGALADPHLIRLRVTPPRVWPGPPPPQPYLQQPPTAQRDFRHAPPPPVCVGPNC